MNDATANLSDLFTAAALTAEVTWRADWMESCLRYDDARLDAEITAKALTKAQSASVDALMESEPAEPSDRWLPLIALGVASAIGLDEDGYQDDRIQLTNKGIDVANSPRIRLTAAERRAELLGQGYFPCGECGGLQAPGASRCEHCGCM